MLILLYIYIYNWCIFDGKKNKKHYYGEQRTISALESLIWATLPLKFSLQTTSSYVNLQGKPYGEAIIPCIQSITWHIFRDIMTWQAWNDLTQELESDVPRESSWWLAIDSYHLSSGSNLHGDFCVSAPSGTEKDGSS